MINISSLKKSFNGKMVLDNLSLTIKDKETLVIIGRSGCGKSVLLKHIIGILKADEGKIIIDGTDITRLGDEQWADFRKNFGMLFQGAALFDSLSVEENIAFGLKRYTDYDEDKIHNIVVEKLKLVGLTEDVLKVKPASLSGGMKKRVGLARAIAMEPSVILYDEPTTGLDPIMSDAINELIIDLRNKLDTTEIVVTHDMKSAYKIAKRVAMLYNGKIIEVGTPEEISNSKNPIVQQFITGSSEGPISIYE